MLSQACAAHPAAARVHFLHPKSIRSHSAVFGKQARLDHPEDLPAGAGAPRTKLRLCASEPRQSRAASVSIVTTSKPADRKSTRLNSSHDQISYAVFCL